MSTFSEMLINMDELWGKLAAVAPKATFVRNDKFGRELIEGLAYAIIIADFIGDFKRSEIVGNAKSAGVIGKLQKRSDQLLELEWEITRLRLSTMRVEKDHGSFRSSDFRRCVRELENQYQSVQRELGKLKTIADTVAQLVPDQEGGTGKFTAQYSHSDAETIGECAARAWRGAGLSLGGNALEDDGFAEFFRALHYELTYVEKIPNEATILAGLRGFPSPRIA